MSGFSLEADHPSHHMTQKSPFRTPSTLTAKVPTPRPVKYLSFPKSNLSENNIFHRLTPLLCDARSFARFLGVFGFFSFRVLPADEETGNWEITGGGLRKCAESNEREDVERKVR